ncbi:MAG: hypothetical protein NXH95_07705 [Pseudomonadaceae bacterium]|nr:hypothetical protein [Pseudomonadaceae bacterium]
MYVQKLLLLVFLAITSYTYAADGIPRTSSGLPDLSGTYDSATLTPLVRPQEYGDNLYLTPEEAEQLSAAEEKAMAQANAESDPNRTAPPEGGDGSAGAAGNVGGYNAFWIDRGTDALLVDGKFRTSIIVDPPNGQFPPLTPAGQMRMAKLFGGVNRTNEGKAWWLEEEGPGPYDNMEQRNTAERCLMGFSGAAPSIPSLYNNFKRIVQTDEHVMILVEMIHDARIIRINGTHPGPEITSWLGDSVGHWEGDTLVVETTNFSDKAAGFFTGGANMHLLERFTKQPNGDLMYRFTVTDLSQWQAPWTGEYVWSASDKRVYEYACHEGNYALGNIMRGARLLEQDEIAGAGQD